MAPDRRLKIRSARPEDARAVAALSGQLGYPVTAVRLRERLRRLARRKDQEVLVALLDGRVVAWAHWARRGSLELDEHAELLGLVVDADHRGGGIGAELVRRAERWARARGLPSLRVRSNVVRERTHAFYERLGFTRTKTQIVFDKRLGR